MFGIKRLIRRITGRPPIPYHASLDTPLLKFSGGDVFTTRDACSSVQIFGGTGSGKTSGSGKSLAYAYLRAGFGGLVCCAKPDEAERWRKLAKACKREGDLVFFDDSAAHRFNFLDYAQHTIGKDGFDNNIVDMLARITEASRLQRSSGGGSDGDNQFFRDAAMQLLANSIPFLRVAYGTIRLRQLYDFITGAPRTRQEAMSPEWMTSSFCSETMKIAGDRALAGDFEAKRVCEQHGAYWISEFPGMGEKTQGSIVTTLTSTIYPFLSGKLAELFCTHTTLVPDFCRHGAIIVLDISARKFSTSGVIAQQIFKMLFQQAMESQAVHDGDDTRPVFCWADECQFFINSYDAEHLSVCRQQKVCNVFITQDMPTYFAKIGHHDVANSLLNKFGTRIFHSSTDRHTCTYAADIIGKVTHYNTTESQMSGENTGGGINLGEMEGSGSGGYGRNQSLQVGYSTYQDYDLKPEYFGQSLRTGGRASRRRVDGVIVINGRNFKSSGKNRIKAEFHQ